MDLKELTDLIAVRQYVINSTSNSSIDRATVNYMGGLLIMIDKKIIELLQTEEFKSYVNFKDVRKAVEEVVRMNNIKSGLTKK
jgi:hypothetical protein